MAAGRQRLFAGLCSVAEEPETQGWEEGRLSTPTGFTVVVLGRARMPACNRVLTGCFPVRDAGARSRDVRRER
ncbi:hypothetical protein NDU88_002419 [Pleurodeles waltl]|uniref:Uncharacterized protein n=1 Tax=Pleurodeles waltl TaxID=8319 RepID=A0AAV7LIR3_PLEWA|nr:hypothetical protein NDU88_002419 [Pleurodeles waltl]